MNVQKEYKYIDLEYLNEMADGEDAFTINIISVYLNQIPNDVTALDEAIAAGDDEQIVFYAHKLKGSFNFIGCVQLGVVFDEIEAHVNTQSGLGELPGLIGQVKAEVQEIAVELRDVLDQIRA